jgi:hypothetical protein
MRALGPVLGVGLASLFTQPAAAVEDTVPGSPPPRARAVGVTIDLLPVALSASVGEVGASGQIWAGLGHWRLRLVGARIAFPNWLAGKDGFEDQRTSVGALLLDYVFGDHFDHWWLGSGFEYWHSSIGHESFGAARASWNTPVWTFGGGYIAPIVGNFYLEPWAAGHVALTDASPAIGGRVYHPQRLNGEVSLKVGVFFDL